MVWCSNQKEFILCLTHKCHCKNLEDILANDEDNQLVNITDEVVVLSSYIHLHSSNISIIGHNNPTVICINRGALTLYDCSDLTIEGITFIGCGAANSAYDNINLDTPVLHIDRCNNVRIQRCYFQYSMEKVVYLENASGYVNFNNCKFVNNTLYRGHGAAIYYESDDDAFNEFIISNCNFSSTKGKGVLYFAYIFHGYNNAYLFNSSFAIMKVSPFTYPAIIFFMSMEKYCFRTI